MTAKCEAALEEVAAQAQAHFVPAEKKLNPNRVPAKPVNPREENSAKIVAETKPPAPPQTTPDDDFLSRYANFDEASVAPAKSEEIEPEPPKRAVRPDAEKIKNAEANVPASLRDYLADRFQTRFSRLVPAEDARIFSSHGEIVATDSADLPQEETDDSAPED